MIARQARPSWSDAKDRSDSDRLFSIHGDFDAFTTQCLWHEPRTFVNVYENRMFRHVQCSVKHSRTLKTQHSFYATLPQRVPTAIPIDGPSRKLLDDLPSVEKNSRERKQKEDPSMCLYFLK